MNKDYVAVFFLIFFKSCVKGKFTNFSESKARAARKFTGLLRNQSNTRSTSCGIGGILECQMLQLAN